MNLQAEKLALIKWMTELSDEAMVNRIKALRNENNNYANQEIQSRADESEKAIQNGEVIKMQEFQEGNQEWLKKQASK